GLKHLAGLKQLQFLNLDRTRVTDAGLKHLAGLKLKSLRIPPSAMTDLGLKNYLAAVEEAHPPSPFLYQVTDQGLKELARFKNLERLGLGKNVTDAGLKELAGLKSLQILWLTHTKVTDAGMKELAGLKNLQTLWLDHTNVTGVGLRELAALTK